MIARVFEFWYLCSCDCPLDILFLQFGNAVELDTLVCTNEIDYVGRNGE